jgi:hypothetical protein
LLQPLDYETSYNFQQLVELYANFGSIGALLGMLFIGLLYRVLYAAFNHREAGDGGRLVAALIFVGLLNIESNFSLVFGAVIQSTLVYVVLLMIIVRRWKVGMTALPRPQG